MRPRRHSHEWEKYKRSVSQDASQKIREHSVCFSGWGWVCLVCVCWSRGSGGQGGRGDEDEMVRLEPKMKDDY